MISKVGRATLQGDSPGVLKLNYSIKEEGGIEVASRHPRGVGGDFVE